MRVGHLLEPYRLVIKEIPDLTLEDLRPDEILVRSEVGGVCGSDLAFYEGTEVGLTYPLHPGRHLHESIGHVVASTSGRFAVGDRVLALPEDRRGLAELFVSTGSTAVPVPHDIPAERLVLAQPLGTVIWGTRHIDSMHHRDIVVLGAGPVGLLWTAVAHLHGARTIVVGDRIPERLAMAREFGATATWNVDEADGIDLVRTVTDGRLADVAVEAVGHRELSNALNAAIRLVRRLGTVVGFGAPDHPQLSFDYKLFWRKNITLVPSNGPAVDMDFPIAVRMIVDGRVPAERLITHRFSFADAPAAYDLVSRRADGVLKVVLAFA